MSVSVILGNQIRAVNGEILDRASIQAITCPSAHEASAFAAALVIFHLEKGIGTVFLWAAVSIAVSTIVGGYHYVAMCFRRRFWQSWYSPLCACYESI